MIYDIIQQLKSESSKNVKIEILEEHKDNELLQKVLIAALDPYTNYYMKKIPDYTPCEYVDEDLGLPVSLKDTMDLVLPMLSSRDVTGHDAIDLVVGALGDMCAEDADVFVRILKKNLDCGVQASTVNKVWPKFIPTYPCLLAKGYDEKTITRMSWPAYSQLKADGMRVNAFVEYGKVTLRGRSGRAVDLHGELDTDLLKVGRYLDDCVVLDGELIVLENDGSVMERRKGNGLLNKAIKGTISQADAARVRIRVWDVIPVDDFHAEKCTTPYSQRWTTVAKAVSDAALNHGAEKVELIEQREVQDLAEAEAHFQEMLARGEEGTILKDPDHIWENKRSYGLIKMKAEKDADLRVVGWVEGTGKYAGKMGALICQSSDGKVEVSVGGGYTDAEREELTEDVILDRIVTVLYNERIKSKDRADVDSLFLPRFVEIREDKNVANSSKDIK
jgi:hypothetical protein